MVVHMNLWDVLNGFKMSLNMFSKGNCRALAELQKKQGNCRLCKARPVEVGTRDRSRSRPVELL